MINPVDLIHLWYKKQPQEVKLETALLVLYSLPEGGYPNPESAEADFLAWLLPVQNMPKDIGKAIIVRSLIDFTCGERFTGAGWNEAGDSWRALCEKELSDRSLRDFSGYLTGRIRK